MKRTILGLLVGGALLVATCGARPAAADSDPGEGVAARANELVNALELDKARAELAKADPSSPAVALAKARLALYEEDCDLATALTVGPAASRDDDARIIADVARGCARVTAATAVDRDDAEGVVVRWQDEDDRALLPLVVDTVVKARASLTRDLGVEWKRPTRITVVRDLLSLSAMTGLPYKSAQTTGTVAVAKWGRVTLLSPRASRHGYPWRDTLTHELTHLAIAMQTHERAPLWLHEGVARREETRWRPPGPFDDRPTPESVVQRGMELKLDLQLDKLGPSIAMLPSADAAMVAFAEVTSFVRFYAETLGDGALAKLLLALRTAKTADEALVSASGETLAQWDVKWRAALAKRPKEALSPLFGLGGAPPTGSTDAHERARLAELLFGRDHAEESLVELDRIPESFFTDPSLRYVKARVLEAKGDAAAAGALVEDPKAWIASYGPCWGLRSRFAFAAGDEASGTAAGAEALAHDPFDVRIACQAPGTGKVPTDPPLCEAARRRGEPDVGGD